MLQNNISQYFPLRVLNSRNKKIHTEKNGVESTNIEVINYNSC